MNRRKTQLIKNNERMKSDNQRMKGEIKDYECTTTMLNDFIMDLQKRKNSILIKTYRLEDDIEKLTRENKTLKSDAEIAKELHAISLKDKRERELKIIELKREISDKTKMAQGNIDLNIINKAKCEKYKEENRKYYKKIKANSETIMDMAIKNVRLEKENKELRAKSGWSKLKEIVGLR
ncbi:MAG TPA: hypothetical protein VIK72_19335 [Clostridiaceae bacterium]